MGGSSRRLILPALVAVAALLAVGVTAASGHGGPGRGLKGARASALVTEAAKQLDVTRARLKDAIVDAAIARINEAVEDGDVDAEDAADLREEARDNLRFAMAVSRTRTVASNLEITTARLNNAFRAARKTLILRRINRAVEDGDLTEQQAAELKEELEDAELPGYKGGFFGFGFGLGRHGFGR